MFGRKSKPQSAGVLEIVPPVSGRVLRLSEVPDEAFASGAMGDGLAVEPLAGQVVAPFEGTVAHLMAKSNHAVLLEHVSGVQLLIHVGMDTVALKGEGFKAHVKTGDSVKRGQLLLEFDIPFIEAAGYSVVTPFIVPDGLDAVKEVEVLQPEADGESLIRVHLA
ncbi:MULTISPECIES: PTS sugar transporter subunit IIA [Saccharibacillus]|uniref:PTS sugar transporter subunit IIA n=1 Tax=Saccharibacillus TaxID=456492 RepID=UPI00123A24C0|nr:PTS glucose transporter subunit IIA [Saccharibacillus sp. WB 17]MWJ30275.1 PTS glucose transporter subunit IIA [Saccharibacillus sp. WB 17]